MKKLGTRLRRFILAVLFSLNYLTPLHAETFQDLNLGPYVIYGIDPQIWENSGGEEVNHRTTLYHKKENAVVTVALEIFTPYEKARGENRDILEDTRASRWFRDKDFLLVFTLKSDSKGKGSAVYRSFVDLIHRTQLNPEYEFSPCVRLGLLKQRVEKWIATRWVLGDHKAIRRYLQSLKYELKKELERGAHHHGAPLNYFLGYLETLNDKGEFMGDGCHPKEALAYFRKALEIEPQAQEPLKAMHNLIQKQTHPSHS